MPTTKELRKDAEFIGTYTTDDTPAGRIALAWLADHPQDDEEPITEDWLNATFGHDDLGVEQHDDWGEAITWLDDIGHMSVPMPRTRGDLRRLCESLGVKIEGK